MINIVTASRRSEVKILFVGGGWVLKSIKSRAWMMNFSFFVFKNVFVKLQQAFQRFFLIQKPISPAEYAKNVCCFRFIDFTFVVLRESSKRFTLYHNRLEMKLLYMFLEFFETSFIFCFRLHPQSRKVYECLLSLCCCFMMFSVVLCRKITNLNWCFFVGEDFNFCFYLTLDFDAWVES